MAELTLEELRRSLTANKGHFTREVQRATKEMQRFEDNNCKRLSTILREVEAKIRRRMEIMSDLYEAALKLDLTQEGQAELSDKSKEVVDTGEATLDLIEGTLKDWDATQEDDDDNFSIPGGTAGGGGTPPPGGGATPPLPPPPAPPTPLLKEIVGL